MLNVANKQLSMNTRQNQGRCITHSRVLLLE